MERSRTVIITGANGFIGSYLRSYLSANNFNVIGFVRSPKTGSSDVKYDISEPLDETAISQAGIVIHCAYIAESANNASSAQANISGTVNLINACRKHNVKFIFFSSLSAHPDAVSSYGRHKYGIEHLLDLKRDVIVKPGLVIGNGGLFLKMLAFARKFHLVPLIEGGKQPLQFIYVRDLAASVQRIIERELSGRFVLVGERVTYRQFYQTISKVYKFKVLFLPLPINSILTTLSIAEKLKLRLPVNRENLLGLKNMQYVEPGDSVEIIGVKPLALEQALKSLTG